MKQRLLFVIHICCLILIPVKNYASEKMDFTNSMIEVLQNEFKDAQITIKDTLLVEYSDKNGNKLEISFGRIYQYCLNNSSTDCKNAAFDYLDKVIESINAQLSIPEPKPKNLRVAIRNEDYLETIESKISEKMIVEKFVNGLWLIYMLDLPTMSRPLLESDLDLLKMTENEVKSIALKNVSNEIGKPDDYVQIKSEKKGFVGYIKSKNYYITSLAVFHNEWNNIASKFKNNLLVSIPCTDMIYYTDGSPEEALKVIEELTIKSYNAAQRPISKVILRWKKDGWEKVAQ